MEGAAMLFRFVGKYTGGRTTINAGVDFVEREPSRVDDPELIRRLSNNPEFEVVHPLDHDGDGEPGGSLPSEKRDVAALQAEVEALGVTVDKRWGEKRLLAEIEKAG
jgi:hypothetical protein